MSNLAQRAADEVAGCNAADLALARLSTGDYTDPELLLRALSRTMADAGCINAVPHAVVSGFLRRVQKHIEGKS
jgi:hypothetical protein